MHSLYANGYKGAATLAQWIAQNPLPLIPRSPTMSCTKQHRSDVIVNVKCKPRDLMAQAVRHSSSTARVPSSRLSHSMWVSWWAKRSLRWFSRGFSHFTLPQISFYHFSTLISFISFHFISPTHVMVSCVVGRHSCYSQTFNKGV